MSSEANSVKKISQVPITERDRDLEADGQVVLPRVSGARLAPVDADAAGVGGHQPSLGDEAPTLGAGHLDAKTQLRMLEAAFLPGSDGKDDALPGEAPGIAAATPGGAQAATLRGDDQQAVPPQSKQAPELRQPEPSPPDAPTPEPLLSRLWVTTPVRRALKVLLGIVVLIFFGWQPAMQLIQTASVEAVVNAPLVVLRAPIDGDLQAPLGSLRAGTRTETGAVLFEVVNPRVDTNRLEDLRLHRTRIAREGDVLVNRIAGLSAARDKAMAQLQTYRRWRLALLDTRIESLKLREADLMKDLETTRSTLTRFKTLRAQDLTTSTQLESVERAENEAQRNLRSHQTLMKATEIERNALAEGIFVSDRFNDQPASAQMILTLEKEMTQLTAEMEDRKVGLAVVDAQIVEEEKRIARRARAQIVSPLQAEVWEPLAGPGEQVKSGQELVRLLDCTRPTVTVSVTRADYNALQLGMTATFIAHGDGEKMTGRVAQLTGLAAAPANLAITPDALAEEPYRVTVDIPQLAETGSCPIGRTGRVVFGNEATPSDLGSVWLGTPERSLGEMVLSVLDFIILPGVEQFSSMSRPGADIAEHDQPDTADATGATGATGAQ